MKLPRFLQPNADIENRKQVLVDTALVFLLATTGSFVGMVAVSYLVNRPLWLVNALIGAIIVSFIGSAFFYTLDTRLLRYIKQLRGYKK